LLFPCSPSNSKSVTLQLLTISLARIDVMIPVRLDTLMTVVCTTAAVVPMIAISACLMPASVQFAMPPPISEP